MGKRIVEATVLLAEFVMVIGGISWLMPGSVVIVLAAIKISPWFLLAFLLHPIALAGVLWVDERWMWR